MKWIVTPILIILVLIQAFSKWIVIAEFNLYRSYIAKHLCENRHRPKLHCNGKCILMKKMVAEENQSSPAGDIKLNWETSLFIDDHSEYLHKIILQSRGQLIGGRYHFLVKHFARDIFHPPLCSIKTL